MNPIFVPWSQADDDFLRRNFASMTLKELARHLARTEGAVSVRAYHMGLKRPHGRRKVNRHQFWSPEEEARLREMAGKKTLQELALEFDRTEASIRMKGRVLGLQFRSASSRFFDAAWPPEKIAILRAGAEEGKSIGLLAEECGTARKSVKKALRQLGIEVTEIRKTRRIGRPPKAKEKKPAPVLPDGWILCREAAPIVGLVPVSVKRLCHDGRLESRKDERGRWIVSCESAERYAEECRRELEQKAVKKLSPRPEKKKAARLAPKRRKPEPKPEAVQPLADEAVVSGMSKLDILKALTGL